jgi:hypothetical protein
MTSFALMVFGALALALGLTVAPAPTTASAMPALQPSPRPTLQPTPDFIPDNDDDPEPTAIPYGRVTGTVIDTRTGAPAANVLVVVGDSIVLTDASGNYDRWVPVGSYRVALQLRDGEGVAAQAGQEVGVTPGGAAVMHLFFTSAAPVAPEAPAAVPTPTAAPTPPLALEPEQPAGQPARQPAVTVAAAEPAAPAGLPDTAGGISVPGPLMLVGALLFGAGALLQLRPRRRADARAAADARMLRRMLAEETRDREEG